MQNTAMRAAHGLTQLEELLKELNPVFSIPFDARISVHLFGTRYKVILNRSENWEEPEECVALYTEVLG